jgi:hypothetical protein
MPLMCMSSGVMHISSPPTYSHIGGTGVHLCHNWSPFVTRTAAKYLRYFSLEKIKTGCGACFSDPENSSKPCASYWLAEKCDTWTGTHLHTFTWILHSFPGLCTDFTGCRLIPPVANWFHRLPTDDTGCQPANFCRPWNWTIGISWQPVESVGRR